MAVDAPAGGKIDAELHCTTKARTTRRLSFCSRVYHWLFWIVSYRYLIPVTERQPEGNADALYAFKSRGFGGEIGLDVARNLALFESSFS